MNKKYQKERRMKTGNSYKKAHCLCQSDITHKAMRRHQWEMLLEITKYKKKLLTANKFKRHAI